MNGHDYVFLLLTVFFVRGAAPLADVLRPFRAVAISVLCFNQSHKLMRQHISILSHQFEGLHPSLMYCALSGLLLFPFSASINLINLCVGTSAYYRISSRGCTPR